jgi:phage tail-like protein
MAQRRDSDALGAYNFLVEIDGVAAGAFRNVEGLSVEINVIEYQDGTDLIGRKRPGLQKVGDVTLKKGYVLNTQLQNWWQQTQKGVLARKSISIALMNNAGEEKCRWNLFDCWPKSWKVSGMDGKGTEVFTEEIAFVTERVEIG